MTMAGEGVKRAVRAGGIAKKFIRKIIRLNKIVGGGRTMVRRQRRKGGDGGKWVARQLILT